MQCMSSGSRTGRLHNTPLQVQLIGSGYEWQAAACKWPSACEWGHGGTVHQRHDEWGEPRFAMPKPESDMIIIVKLFLVQQSRCERFKTPHGRMWEMCENSSQSKCFLYRVHPKSCGLKRYMLSNHRVGKYRKHPCYFNTAVSFKTPIRAEFGRC